MKRFLLSVAFPVLLCACSSGGDVCVTDYVDPFAGTGLHGHTYPGASVPFGMVQLSPDTRTAGWDACSGYHYDDTSIIGFSHTHLSGTGCADLLDVLFSPYSSLPDKSDSLYVLAPHRFSHKGEHAECGYYSVEFPDEGIKAEMTAAARTGVHRYTFRNPGERYVIIDLIHAPEGEKVDMSALDVVSDSRISGMRRTQGWVADQYVYFDAEFSVPFEDAEIIGGRQALLRFPSDADTVAVAVGISAVSAENARENRTAEVPGTDFDRTRSLALALWKDALGRITVSGGTRKDRENFYTACYHSMLVPNVMNDVNGQYRRNDNTVAEVPEGRTYYSTFSLWDTFRAWNPLQTLLDTAFVNDMIWSMLDMYDCSGELPIWPLASGETGTMIGYHSVSVISDAYCKGIRGYDAAHALEAMVRSSDINSKGSDRYLEYGYVPSDLKRESVSLTLEFAYDDWAIAMMADSMGRHDIADRYYSRAASYMNVFDGSTCFFRGRNSDGSWAMPFNEFSTGRDYTEATPWHYRFFVPHDVNGMMQLFGGKDEFVKALDDLFTLESADMEVGVDDVAGFMGQYAHGNEPSHHMAWLYNYAGEPWKAQDIVRKLQKTMYSPDPDGIIGNEDCGQMSAWYILSSAGLYQVCPGSGEFLLSAPLFDEVSVSLPGGRILHITADNPVRNRYISGVTFDGEPVDVPYIGYGRLMKGGELHFTLSDRPDKEWGCAGVPYSMTEGEMVSMPYTLSQVNLFEDRLDLDLGTATQGAEIRYTTDGSEPGMSSAVYDAPVRITGDALIKARAFKEGLEPSPVLVLKAVKADYLPENPAAGKTLVPGVDYRFYEGKFSSVAQMLESSPVSYGTMSVPSILDAPHEDHYGYGFSGYVDIPERGVWEFMTKSDDGSVLYIDGRKTVDNDGSHAAVSATGRIALDKGLHRFSLLYFEDYEGQELAWGWKAPGDTEFSDIPADKLFHED